MQRSVSCFLDLTVPCAPCEPWDPVSEAQFLLREMGQQHRAPPRAVRPHLADACLGLAHTVSESPLVPSSRGHSPLGVVCTSSLTSAKPMESIALAQEPPPPILVPI